MVLRVINRLKGRTDLNDDAVNAYVDGNASSEQLDAVRELIKSDPALEKDLSTQQALRSVLGRIDRIDAPRSFAVTPEMIAAAERSESGITRFAELFGPQRKLALAPAIVAGVAALSVALLTIGDIAGLIEQSRAGSDDSATAASISTESAVAEAELMFDAGGATGGAPGTASGDASTSLDDEAAVAESGRAVAPAATSAMPEPSSKTAGDTSDIQSEAAPEMEMTMDSEPPSLAAGGSSPQLESDADDSAAITMELEEVASDGAAMDIDVTETEPATEAAVIAESTEDELTLPLRQLQLALAAVAVLSVLAWAGLRRVRGE